METKQDTTPDAEPEYMGSATYCPEDNKLRLYVGRVPRSDFERLRAMGWTSTPKQNCDFVSYWSPERRDLCLEWCGSIEDEDQSPAERAADRAERFGDYRDKRTGDASGHADRYDVGPAVHGFQNYGKAVRAAYRHDRIAGRAVDAWGKAEYWQRRTAGVISHALHVCAPAVRMGRIKEVEAEIRKIEKTREEYVAKRKLWQTVAAQIDVEKQNRQALAVANVASSWVEYQHPRQATIKDSLWALLISDRTNGDPITGSEAAALYLAEHPEVVGEGDWLTHYRLRLDYENQMIEAQGGRAAFIEMEAGGWLGSRQIRKVCKSPATGRVVSVEVMGTFRGFTRESGYKIEAEKPRPVLLNVERLAAEVYRAPTDEDRAALRATLAGEKNARPEKAPCPLINPTDDDAERLQAIWNERAKAEHARRVGPCGKDFEPSEICRIAQATYSINSAGSHSKAETRGLCADGELKNKDSNMWNKAAEDRAKRIGPALCNVRITWGDNYHGAKRVIVITDKPQKPLPAAVWSPRVEVQADLALV